LKKVICVLLLLFFGSSSASAALSSALSPSQTIAKASITVMTMSSLGTPVSEIMEELSPLFDFEKFTKLSVGSAWNKISKKEKEQLTGLVSKLIKLTYTASLKNYSSEVTKINVVKEVKKERHGKYRAVVYVDIINPDKTIPVLYKLYLSPSSKWMIYDFKVEGISIVSTYRSSFAQEINSSGVQGLINKLTDKVKK